MLLTGKNSPAGEKASDRRKSCRPTKKLPTGKKGADRRRKRCRISRRKLPASFCRLTAFSPVGEFFAGQQFCQSAAFSLAGEFSPVSSFLACQPSCWPASF
jgi:hypothetical protein